MQLAKGTTRSRFLTISISSLICLSSFKILSLFLKLCLCLTRAAHHGELSIECLKAYYLYGRALLCKAQEETDPLLSVPKKESETQQESTKSAVIRESSVASVSSNSEQDGGKELFNTRCLSGVEYTNYLDSSCSTINVCSRLCKYC